jgi:hypothetical protein
MYRARDNSNDYQLMRAASGQNCSGGREFNRRASAPTTVRDRRAPYQNTPRMINAKKITTAKRSNPPMIFLFKVPLR